VADVALWAVLFLAMALQGCGQKREFLLVVRDDANRPLAGIEIRDATTGALLGGTDETGSVRFQPPKGAGGVLRVRLRAGADAPAFEFEDPIILTDADLRQGARLVRGRSTAPADSTTGRAVLAVETEPPGATVMLNDQPVGPSAVVLRNLEPGRVQVQLRLDGYETHAVDLLLLEGENKYVWELRRKDGPAVAPRSAPPPPPAASTEAPSSQPAPTSASNPVASDPMPTLETEETPRTIPTPRERPPEPAAPAAPAADDRTAIGRLLESYAAALERRDLEAYAALFTTLSSENRDKLRAAFGDLQSQEVELRDVEINVSGARGEARFVEIRTMKFRAGRDQRLERDLSATTVRLPDGRWRLEQIRSIN